MINLVQHPAQSTHIRYGAYADYCGQLFAPDSQYDISETIRLNMCWAVDNGCFKRYEPEKILNTLKRYQGVENCLFFVAPDVVCNHDATLKLFHEWRDVIKGYGYPIAFVCQNGATIENVPFEQIDAVFIGGDNNYKYSGYVDAILHRAGWLGIHRHQGRLSSFKRFNWFEKHCESFDSSGFSRWPDAMTGQHIKWINTPRTTRMILT